MTCLRASEATERPTCVDDGVIPFSHLRREEFTKLYYYTKLLQKICNGYTKM